MNWCLRLYFFKSLIFRDIVFGWFFLLDTIQFLIVPLRKSGPLLHANLNPIWVCDRNFFTLSLNVLNLNFIWSQLICWLTSMRSVTIGEIMNDWIAVHLNWLWNGIVSKSRGRLIVFRLHFWSLNQIVLSWIILTKLIFTTTDIVDWRLLAFLHSFRLFNIQPNITKCIYFLLYCFLNFLYIKLVIILNLIMWDFCFLRLKRLRILKIYINVRLGILRLLWI